MLRNPDFICFYSIFIREFYRFIKVYHQTIISPIINTLILVTVFSMSFSNFSGVNFYVDNINYNVFVISGLIMMSAMQNSFANSSSSFIIGKILGSIIDYIIPPISNNILIFSIIFSSILRGVIIALISYIILSFFFSISVFNIYITCSYIVLGCAFLSLIGIISGIVCDSYDQLSAFMNFFINPFTFLSGTFYSVSRFQDNWIYVFIKYNPFFFIIDGFRYGLIGYSEGDLVFGSIYLVTVIIVSYIVVFVMLSKGYKLKN